MRIRSLFLIFSLFCASLAGQEIPWRFNHLTIDEGLAHADATSVLQDKTGFIWLGTYSGLHRFDGNHLQVFYVNEGTHLDAKKNRIARISQDEQGLIWLATDCGVTCFDPLKETFVPWQIKGSVMHNKSATNAYRTNEYLWVLYSEGAIEQYKIKKGFILEKVDQFPKDLPTNKGRMMHLDAQNRLWVGTQKGLYVCHTPSAKNKKWVQLQIVDEGKENIRLIHSVAIHNGYVFLGIMKGILFFTEKELSAEKAPLQIDVRSLSLDRYFKDGKTVFPSAGFQVFTQDFTRSGELWAGTPTGLFRIKNPTGKPEIEWMTHNEWNPYSLSANYIEDLLIDQSDCLWACTFGGGANWIDLRSKKFGSVVQNPRIANTLPQNYVQAIFEDEQYIWYGTRDQGLCKFDKNTGQYTTYKKEANNANSLAGNSVRTILKDRSGKYWVGTEEGISILTNPANPIFENITPQNSELSGILIFTLAEDMFGQIWAGSWQDGLNCIRYKGKGQYEIVRYYSNSVPHRLLSNRITFIYADPLRAEVLVSCNEGLHHIFLTKQGDVNTIRVYGKATETTSLRSTFFWPIVRPHQDTLFAGTLGGGLYRIALDNQGNHTITVFSEQEGLPFLDVESLLLDRDGNLWLGGRGISTFNRQSQTFTNYEIRDGLSSNSFKIGSAFINQDGRLYFGSTKGVNFFYPNQIQNNPIAPRAAFTQLTIGNTPVSPQNAPDLKVTLNKTIANEKKVQLKHYHNNFQVDFSNFHYANPSKARYKYRLSEYHDDWVYTSTPQAVFSNVSVGSHALTLYATNNDGVWGTQPATLHILITPPWWRTILAYILYVLLGIGLVYAVLLYLKKLYYLRQAYHLRVLEEQKQEEIHRLKLEFFTNISHEFRTPLTLIINPLEQLKKEIRLPSHQNRIQLVTNNAKKLLSLVNELLDFRKSESETTLPNIQYKNIVEQVEELCSQFKETAQEKDILLRVEQHLITPFQYYDEGMVSKIITNLLSNALKYTSPGGVITVLLQNEPTNRGKWDYYETAHEQASPSLWIGVSDSGVGISKDSLSKVFDRYFQVSNTSRHLGSGIGLAFVKNLVMAHKGVIRVYSQREEGSLFWVGLPAREQDWVETLQAQNNFPEKNPGISIWHTPYTPVESQLALTTHMQGASSLIPTQKGLYSVLLVEDNEELLALLKENFIENYEIFVAENGQAALELALDVLPDLVITDVMMPVMNGIELCKNLRLKPETRHLPIIMLSARQAIEHQLEGVESGADYYFPKPFNLDILNVTIRNVFEKQHYLREKQRENYLLPDLQLADKIEDKTFLDNVVSYIHKHMESEELDVPQLCKEMGISRTKLYNQIKEITGTSPNDFIRIIRLRKAAQLLSTENIPVVEVMYKVGIQSKSYFSKAFKKEFGKSPSEFVQQLRDNITGGL